MGNDKPRPQLLWRNGFWWKVYPRVEGKCYLAMGPYTTSLDVCGWPYGSTGAGHLNLYTGDEGRIILEGTWNIPSGC